MSGPQIASHLLPQQIIFILVPVGDLISIFFLNLTHLEFLLVLVVLGISLSHYQKGKETWGFHSVLKRLILHHLTLLVSPSLDL